jgi:hypothetical protein
MNKKARKQFKAAVNDGYSVGVWHDKRRKRYVCEVARPTWSSSCVEYGPTLSKAVLKTIAQARMDLVVPVKKAKAKVKAVS